MHKYNDNLYSIIDVELAKDNPYLKNLKNKIIDKKIKFNINKNTKIDKSTNTINF